MQQTEISQILILNEIINKYTSESKISEILKLGRRIELARTYIIIDTYMYHYTSKNIFKKTSEKYFNLRNLKSIPELYN